MTKDNEMAKRMDIIMMNGDMNSCWKDEDPLVLIYGNLVMEGVYMYQEVVGKMLMIIIILLTPEEG